MVQISDSDSISLILKLNVPRFLGIGVFLIAAIINNYFWCQNYCGPLHCVYKPKRH